MEDNEMTIDLAEVAGKMLRAVLKTWKIALPVLFLAALATAAVAALTYTPLYEAKTTFAVTKEMNGEENYLYNKDATDELSVSFESILYSDVMQGAMCDELGTETLPAELLSSRVGTTNLFTVAASGEDPDAVSNVLDAFLNNYGRVFRSTLMNFTLDIIENPEDAVVCNSPQYLKKEVYVCGALIVLYVACIAMYSLFRRTITEEEQVKDYLRTSCLGSLPYVRSAKKDAAPLITADGSRYYEMKEAVGAIRRRLEKEKKDSGASVFLMTGAAEREGTSTTAANLALSLAYRGWKTALLDLNFRKPSQLRRFPLENGDQRKEAGRIGEMEICWQKTSLTDRIVIYGGREANAKASGVLDTEKLKKMLGQFSEKYDFVIIDGPPLLTCADTLILAKQADASIFVLQEDMTATGSLIDAMEMLNEVSNKIMGCIINCSRTHVSRYGYGYGYGYKYSYGYGYGYGYGHRYGYGYGYGRKERHRRARGKQEEKKETQDS